MSKEKQVLWCKDYSVDVCGNVFSNKFNRRIKLKGSIDRDGYKLVALCKNNKTKTFKVHRLVAEAFIERVDGKNIIDHIDGNPSNNNVSNLRWCTNLENNNFNNRKKDITGIRIMPSGNYQARVMIDGKRMSLGTFKTLQEAKDARKKTISI